MKEMECKNSVNVRMHVESLEKNDSDQSKKICVTCGRNKKTRLIIDATTIYEYDEECIANKST